MLFWSNCFSDWIPKYKKLLVGQAVTANRIYIYLTSQVISLEQKLTKLNNSRNLANPQKNFQVLSIPYFLENGLSQLSSFLCFVLTLLWIDWESSCNEDLENTVINICKESGINADARDIEGCHRLPLSKNSRGHDKRVIVKFVNRKYVEALLKDKKRISAKNFGHLHITNKVFVSVFLCPCYRFIWDKCKDLKRQGNVHHVFCLGGIVSIKLSEKGSPVKLHHISDIPNFPSDSVIEN